MSVLQSHEERLQDVNENGKGTIRCRIPQRLPPKKISANSNARAKGQNAETALRPKSANRINNELFSGRPGHRAVRAERFNTGVKKPAVISKRMPFETTVQSINKGGKPTFIKIPSTSQNQKSTWKSGFPRNGHTNGLPDQETIKQHEELEARQSPDSFNFYTNEEKETNSRGDKLVELKISWQDNIVQYEKYKQDLKERQRAVLEIYAALRNVHREMIALGEKRDLPSADDLQIMNVCKLTPEQLLQLCSEHNDMSERQRMDSSVSKVNIPIDINKVSNIPGKLIKASEQTLLKRKEIIDWFANLLTQEGGISVQNLLKKINKFNGENEMLQGTLDELKIELSKELEEIFQCLRKSANDSMTLQLRSEQLTYELAELNSQNTDLRKRIAIAENTRSVTNKHKVEEIEKELKEEKCKRLLLKNQLSRAEGQLKINEERANQLDAALEEARTRTWTLEQTVQQLHDQNQKLQNDFDKELSKWSESMKLLESHTAHIEEIAEARNRLQAEKEDLEKKLAELSNSYDESINNLKCDLSSNTARLIEAENNYAESCEEKKQLETQVQSMRAQLLEYELRLKETVKEIEEKDNLQNELRCIRKEFDNAKSELENYYAEIEDYRKVISKQNETINEAENKLTTYVSIEQSLIEELANKDEYITELEKKLALLEEQLQENESKMEAYVSQLATLKGHITDLQEDFGEFENLDELHEMINKQRDQLHEANCQNRELSECLEKKDEQLEQYANNLAEQEHLLEQREDLIKVFSVKEEEQSNIIKILRNNLELRSQADNDLNQQVMEKNAEIESLIANVETRKKQICNLEKIILTLEEQTRKANIQKRKDQDKIAMLQKRVSEFENYHLELGARGIDLPAENLDNLIKKLEDELGTPLETQLSKEHNFGLSKMKYSGDRKRDGEMHEGEINGTMYRPQAEGYPTKIWMGNIRKNYMPNKEDQHQGDNLDRKKAITCIDTQRWSSPNPMVNNIGPTNRETFKRIVPNLSYKEHHDNRNLHILPPTGQIRDERKYKMFKLAGHRLT